MSLYLNLSNTANGHSELMSVVSQILGMGMLHTYIHTHDNKMVQYNLPYMERDDVLTHAPYRNAVLWWEVNSALRSCF